MAIFIVEEIGRFASGCTLAKLSDGRLALIVSGVEPDSVTKPRAGPDGRLLSTGGNPAYTLSNRRFDSVTSSSTRYTLVGLSKIVITDEGAREAKRAEARIAKLRAKLAKAEQEALAMSRKAS